MRTPWLVNVGAGVLIVAMAVAIGVVAWPLPRRARWVFAVRESFAALIGVGLAIEPWARSAGNGVSLVGFLGLLTVSVLGRRLRGEVRTAP